MTGSRTVIHIASLSEHCKDYDKTCQVMTQRCLSRDDTKIENYETILLYSPRTKNGQITLVLELKVEKVVGLLTQHI